MIPVPTIRRIIDSYFMTNTLFSFIPNIVNFTQAKQIAELALHVYEKALEIYEQQSPPTSPQTGEIDFSKSVFTHWAMSTVEQLAIEREPLLLKFQNAD